MRLRNKINLSTAFLFFCLFILSNISIYFVFSNLILDSEIEQAQAEAEKIANGINDSLGTISEETLLRAYIPIHGMIQIVTSDNKSFTTVTSPSEKKLSSRSVHYFIEERSDRIEYRKNTYSFDTIPIILSDGQVANLSL